MGKCSLNTRDFEPKQIFLSLPSGVAVRVTVRDDTRDGRPGAIVEVKRQDGKPLSQAEMTEAKEVIIQRVNAIRQRMVDVFENWDLGNGTMKFSRSWFNDVERSALVILNAGTICDWRTQKPVNSKALQAQKRIASVILDRVKRARHAASRGNGNIDRFGVEIRHLLSRFLSEPDRLRGREFIEQARKGGKARGRRDASLHQQWQSRADSIWAAHPSWGARYVAQKIAEQLPGSKSETIRRVISPPA